MLDEIEHARRIREEQQAAVILVLRVVVDADGLVERDDMALDARGRDLLEKRRTDLVICDVIVADDDALAVRDLGPNRDDLSVDETVINAC